MDSLQVEIYARCETRSMQNYFRIILVKLENQIYFKFSSVMLEITQACDSSMVHYFEQLYDAL